MCGNEVSHLGLLDDFDLEHRPLLTVERVHHALECLVHLVTDFLLKIFTSEGDNVFQGCAALETVDMGRALMQMGSSVFWGCTRLTDVACKAVVPPAMGNLKCFDPLTYSNSVLWVPASAVVAYQSADYWSEFDNIVAIVSDTGDVNGDGEVTIADVNALINAILMGGYAAAADVNEDGEVSVADINALIDMILSA